MTLLIKKTAIALTLIWISNFAHSQEYTTYCNYSQGFCFEYPPNYFTSVKEISEGSAIKLRNSDEKSKLLIGAKTFSQNFSLTQIMSETQNENIALGYTITYQKLFSDFFVMSGTNGEKEFYTKVMIRDGQLLGAYYEYPEVIKNYIGKMLKRIFKSIKWI